MQREIKFRVWDRDLNIFQTVPLFHLANNKITLNHDVEKICGKCRFVIQQYTGLKDKNGVEVYEGDIVSKQKTSDDDFANVGHIFFAAGTFMIDGDGPLYEYTKSLTPDILEDYVVVGNVFENSNEY